MHACRHHGGRPSAVPGQHSALEGQVWTRADDRGKSSPAPDPAVTACSHACADSPSTAQIKLHEPQEDALDHLISVGRDAAGGDLVTPTTLDRVCEAMGDGTRRSAFAPNGSAWLLDAGMKRSGEIGVDQVAGWWAEESMAHNLTDWITTTFHGSLLLERHGQYLRFRIMPVSAREAIRSGGAASCAPSHTRTHTLRAGQALSVASLLHY